MAEIIIFPDTQEQLELPKGLKKEDLSRALEYRDWLSLRMKVQGGFATDYEKQTFNSIPTVADKPAWVSTLTEDERERFESAYAFVQKVEEDPDSYFTPID